MAPTVTHTNFLWYVCSYQTNQNGGVSPPYLHPCIKRLFTAMCQKPKTLASNNLLGLLNIQNKMLLIDIYSLLVFYFPLYVYACRHMYILASHLERHYPPPTLTFVGSSGIFLNCSASISSKLFWVANPTIYIQMLRACKIKSPSH